MNTLKAFLAATTFGYLTFGSLPALATTENGAITENGGVAENVAATEGTAPKTTFKLYHEPEAGPTARSVSNGISVELAEINLLDDYDGDGHYSRFQVNYDANDKSGGDGLYAYTVVSLVDESGRSYELFTSPTFYIEPGTTSRDAQHNEITLLDDYPYGHYRVRVDLYDACCSEKLDTMVTSSQEPLALEGQYYDDTYRESTTTTTVEHTSYEEDGGAGGAWQFGGMGALSIMYFLRRRRMTALLDEDTEDND